MADTKIGEIIHYYDKIGVAVVKVLSSMKVGDKIKIAGHDNEFEQTVGSMQVEHESIDQAKKGADVGMKVEQPVKSGDDVYKVA